MSNKTIYQFKITLYQIGQYLFFEHNYNLLYLPKKDSLNTLNEVPKKNFYDWSFRLVAGSKRETSLLYINDYDITMYLGKRKMSLPIDIENMDKGLVNKIEEYVTNFGGEFELKTDRYFKQGKYGNSRREDFTFEVIQSPCIEYELLRIKNILFFQIKGLSLYNKYRALPIGEILNETEYVRISVSNYTSIHDDIKTDRVCVDIGKTATHQLVFDNYPDSEVAKQVFKEVKKGMREIDSREQKIDIMKGENMKNFENKNCPYCNHKGVLRIGDLDRGNGHGYPGHYLYSIICPNPCCAMKPQTKEISDIYLDKEVAIQSAWNDWNWREENL